MIQNQSKPVHPTHGASLQPHEWAVNTAAKRPGKLLRLPAVEERTGFKKSSVYAGVKAGTFPAPVRLSARAVGWREEDLDKWVSERVSTGTQ